MEHGKPQSMAIAYALKKRAQKMAAGGMVREEKASGYGDMPCPDCEMGSCMAHGGMAEDTDMIGRIMKRRMAKGGAVENDTPPLADFEEDDFDVLPGMEDTEADETGENSGDEIGDERLEDDERDVVSRIMRSRKKKDMLPRPA